MSEEVSNMTVLGIGVLSIMKEGCSVGMLLENISAIEEREAEGVVALLMDWKSEIPIAVVTVSLSVLVGMITVKERLSSEVGSGIRTSSEVKEGCRVSADVTNASVVMS